MLQTEQYNESTERSLVLSLQDLEYELLKNVNLKIKPGEIYSIIGKSDSGKNELLRCINRINQPTYGKITFDHQNLNSLLEEKDFNHLRRKIALITKNPQFIATKNILHNVAIPLILEDQLTQQDLNKVVESTLHFVGIPDKLFNFPNQLNLLQKQLVNIARALVTKPKILLFEDITYHLDIKATHQIVTLLSAINKEFGTTIIIVSNDIEIIKTLSHRVGVMEKGTIIEESSAFEIFARPKTEFAKELVKSASRHEMPWVYRKKIRFQSTQNQHPMIRISFTNSLATEHLLAHLIQAYQFKINIIQAYQEHIQKQPINVILAEIEGLEDEDFQRFFAEAILFLQSHELHVEVLGYVANIA